MNLSEYIAEMIIAVDEGLDTFLPAAGEAPATIHEAMRYSVFAGGKRIRPLLCFAAAEACGGTLNAALPAASAVEMMHTYSLVHDDLPCMDDDDLRRGRPTCHKVYGDGMAVLCGDALLTQALATLARAKETERYTVGAMLAELADAGGSRKLIGGQVLDLEGEGKKLSEEDLRAIHLAKTAALLTSAVKLGGMSANASEPEIAALERFGIALGLAFQVIDDILDVTRSTEQLGKTAGKDEAVDKATYPAVMGLEMAREEAHRLTDEAMEALRLFEARGERLRELARWMLSREY